MTNFILCEGILNQQVLINPALITSIVESRDKSNIRIFSAEGGDANFLEVPMSLAEFRKRLEQVEDVRIHE